MSNTKTRTNTLGTFVMTRADTAKEFTCGRCTQPKVSKVTVEWTDKQGVTKTICNGCHGRLLSLAAETPQS